MGRNLRIFSVIEKMFGLSWIRTRDLTLIRGALLPTELIARRNKVATKQSLKKFSKEVFIVFPL